MTRRTIRFALGQLPTDQGDRFRRVCGLLARPRLEPPHQEALREIVLDRNWRPLPRLSAIYVIEPLLTHNAIQAGIPAERLFQPRADGESSSAVFSRLVTNYYLRRRILTETFTAFTEAGVERILLVKGAALAPLYPSPALRDMEDADVLVLPGHFGRAAGVLRRLGWVEREGSWAHPSGCLMDLQIEPVDGRFHVNPHPAWPGLPVSLPAEADHLALLARHSAQHYGLRIWRDLCDLNLLLDHGRRVDLAREALELAVTRGCAASMIALFLLINKWMRPVFPLPEEAGPDFRSESAACRLHFQLYEQLMVDRISEFGFVSIASVLKPPAQMLGSLARATRGIVGSKLRGGSPAAEPSQRDPQFGNVPPVDTIGRQMMKFQFVFEAIRTGYFGHYRRLLKRARIVRAGGKKSG